MYAVQTENKSLPLAISFIFSLIIYHMVRVVNNVNHYQDHLEFNKATVATTRKEKKKITAEDKLKGKNKRKANNETE